VSRASVRKQTGERTEAHGVTPDTARLPLATPRKIHSTLITADEANEFFVLPIGIITRNYRRGAKSRQSI
jgi:hypothetical protein